MCMCRRAGFFVDTILKGSRPAGIPMERPRSEFVLNLSTAKALGRIMPMFILLRADKVIE
jgi:putative tryptophan/tyrosine transport system substrate-binding protein